MNCPNCKKEVFPDWNVCPRCGYKPKKCSNPSCHSGWLPQEARFCPVCGSKVGGNALSVTEKPVSQQEPVPQKSRPSTVSAPAGSPNQTSRSTSTSMSSRTPSVSQKSSYTPSRSSSSTSSARKRFGRFIGSLFLGTMGFVFVI